MYTKFCVRCKSLNLEPQMGSLITSHNRCSLNAAMLDPSWHAPRNLDCAGRRGQALMLLVKFMWHAWSNLQLFGIQVDSWNSLLFISECPPPPLPGCYIRKTNIQIPRPLTYFWVAQTNDPSAHRPITLWQEMEGAREGACREKPQFRHRIGCVALVLLASCKFLDIARYFLK